MMENVFIRIGHAVQIKGSESSVRGAPWSVNLSLRRDADRLRTAWFGRKGYGRRRG